MTMFIDNISQEQIVVQANIQTQYGYSGVPTLLFRSTHHFTLTNLNNSLIIQNLNRRIVVLLKQYYFVTTTEANLQTAWHIIMAIALSVSDSRTRRINNQPQIQKQKQQRANIQTLSVRSAVPRTKFPLCHTVETIKSSQTRQILFYFLFFYNIF